MPVEQYPLWRGQQSTLILEQFRKGQRVDDALPQRTDNILQSTDALECRSDT